MTPLCDALCHYLKANGIDFTARDFRTADDGKGDRIVHWDAAKLGPQPTADQIETAGAEFAKAAAAPPTVAARLAAIGLTVAELKAELTK